MNKIATTYSYRCDLNAGPLQVDLPKPLMQQDALGDVFQASVWRGPTPVDLSGVSVLGFLYLAATQQTILLEGSVSDSGASVALTSPCYAIPGGAALVIQLQEGDVRHTVLRVNMSIARTGTDCVIDPGSILPTLPELLARIDALERATDAARTAAAEAQQAASDTRRAAQELSEVTAPPIIPTATGEVVTITDSANRPLAGLRLYGKTTQDGVPTPNSPVPLVNAGAGGSIGVKASGKNLLNASKCTFNNAVKEKFVELVKINERMIFLPGVDYTISFDTTNTGIRCYVHETLGAGSHHFTMDGTRKSFTFNHPDGCTTSNPVNCITRYTDSSDVAAGKISNIQIERGSTATAYAPYKDGGSLTTSTPNGLPGIPVSSGGNYTDASGQQWLCDEVDFARGVYVQNCKLATSFTFRLYDASRSVFIANLGFSKQMNVGMCNMYSPRWDVSVSNMPDKSWRKIEYDEVFIRDTAYTTAEAFNAAMKDKLTILCPIATPVETPLSADELAAYRAMTSHKPNTTVCNDAGAGMAVDYIADTKNYIDKKIAAIAAAALNT